jgi:hypothetical protein
MIGNQVVYNMFEFNICNHMDIFILRYNGNEDPGYCHMDLGGDGVFISLY